MVLTEARCCRLLGLHAAATLDETRAAYRRIARLMHPDRAGGDAERFKEITAAYNWLVARRTEATPPPPKAERQPDPRARQAHARRAWQAEQARRAAERAQAEAEAAAEEARREAERARAAKQRARAAKRKAREAERARVDARWDEEFTDAWEAWCRTAERYHAARAGRAPEGEPEARPWTPPTADAQPAREADADEEAAAGAEGKGASIFGRMRDGLRRMTRRAGLDRVGQDVSLRLPVDVPLLMNGGARRIAITRAAACPSCAGRAEDCGVCAGAGRVDLRETVRVTIPAGARTGARLRLEGKGTAGLDGAPDGDLFLLLEPEAIPGFRVDGLDLHGQVSVSAALAERGGTVAVELPGGKVKLSVPGGSRPGDRFRLRGQGLPAWGGGARGDLFLGVVVR